MSEEIRRVLGSVNITTHFRPPGTLRQVLFHLKDKVPKGKKMNVVYQAECGQCGERYVGATQQLLSKWVHQHTHSAAGRLNSAVLDHMCATGHVLDLDSFTILEWEADWRRRGIREAVYVKRVVPGLNEWWIVLCLVPGVGQTPRVKSSSQQTWKWPWTRPKLVVEISDIYQSRGG